MRSILVPAGRLVAVLVAGVLALTILSSAPSSAAPGAPGDTLPATTSAHGAIAARPVARATVSRCWRRHRRCYGSFFVNPKTHNVYFANDKMTRRAATSTAGRKCRSHAYHKYCRSAGWVRNYCMAAAVRVPAGTATITQWASAGGRTPKGAFRKAKAKLGGPARNHYRWAYLCTTRPRR